ncbi:AbgT family transporter [Facklamia miroungae]|uniref:Aminobenzoyl-glutamate transport protein n=1 Tax=Facklamia miroungae TaxID=120956 RepID=A0A1G7SLU8_9LACT|nr:AbgT family transporter [Facklamia miroungae]NKZ29628.1 AbgT family transporter [Facklamia miroungae]SDG23210.1 aminobenzoyl-glutamate transport protein [Facklamia miroungae]
MKTNNNGKKSFVQRSLDWIEKVGNKLPHPVVIFIILSIITILVSEWVYRAGVSVEFFDAKANETTTINAISLFNSEGLYYIFQSAVSNFTGFAPMGTVLVTMLGVGVAEWSGLIGSALTKLILKVPNSLLTMVIVFAGIISNIASDAGYVVVVPLGAIMFAGARRHPIAGLAAAFAGVSGGFSANLMFGPTDALLSGITNVALNSSGNPYEVSINGNWYFLIVSTFVLTIVGTLITEKVVEPHLGAYHGDFNEHEASELSLKEEKGLKNAGIALLLSLVVAFLLMNPWFGPFQTIDPETGQKTLQPFMNSGLLFMVFLLFAVPGYVFGKTTGKIKDSNDFVESMIEAMRSMAGFIVMAFFASQLIAYFSHSNLGIILASKGADFLQNQNISGIPLILAFIIFSAFINLFIGSASAKWAILAPIFVPMFIAINLSPEMTQMAYRVADSSTNIISPLMNYFAMILVFMQRYDKKSGIGTLISTMLPYSIAFLIFWSVLLIIWYALNIPLGPGAPVQVSMIQPLIGLM